MKNKIFTTFCLFLAVCASALSMYQTMENIELVHKYNQCIAELNSSHFDTSAINEWCGEFEDGDIRIIGAVSDGEVLEDETGNLWLVDLPLSADEYYLIWLADSHTPNDVTDDIVVKVWQETH